MTVIDLVGRDRGDIAGLSALAARLRRAADALTTPPDVIAVLAAADAVDAAVEALRGLPVPAPVGAVLTVEAALAAALAAPLAALTREGTH